MISSGMTNAEAGRRLQLSVHAIKFHLAEIYRRLGVSNRTEAAVAYLRLSNGSPTSSGQRLTWTSGSTPTSSGATSCSSSPGSCLRSSLAMLSVVRVSTDGLTYRHSQLWSSTTRLAGHAERLPGGAALRGAVVGAGNQHVEPVSPGEPIADPQRFATLAIYYAELITSDPVRELIRTAAARFRGEITRHSAQRRAIRRSCSRSSTSLAISHVDARRHRATRTRTARALSIYISDQQRANKVRRATASISRRSSDPHGATVYPSRARRRCRSSSSSR